MPESREPSATDVSGPGLSTDSALRFLSRSSRRLAESLDYESTLLTVAGMALPYLGSWCIVDIVEPDGTTRRLGIVHPDRRKQEVARRLTERWVPRADDAFGVFLAMRTRASEIIPHVSDETIERIAGTEDNRRDLRALGIGSVIVVPLIARRSVLGAITFVSTDIGPEYTETDLELAEDLATRCAVAIDNARLFRDVDEARNRAAQLNERLVVASIRQQELAEVAREANEAKSRFLATMSHEIRTPINAIVGYTELLETGVAGPVTDRQKGYLARIAASSHHLTGLINDVLDLAKIESGRLDVRKDTCSVDRVVMAAMTMIEPQASEAEVEVRTECSADGLNYRGDEDRVRQIVIALLSNAVKFTEPNGTVRVTCGATDSVDPQAELPEDGTWTYIRIEDTGIGISPEEARTVFDPFVQVDAGNTRKQGGAGLGLAIARQLARRMDGDLTVRSVKGSGSCFTIWLPGAPSGDFGDSPPHTASDRE